MQIIDYSFPNRIRFALSYGPISTELINICLTLFANDLERWNKNAVSTFTLFLRGLAPQQIARETGVYFTTAYRHMREKHLEDYQKMFALLSGELEKEISVQAAH